MTYTYTIAQLEAKLAEYDEIYQSEIDSGHGQFSAWLEADKRLRIDSGDLLHQLVNTMHQFEILKEAVKDALDIPEYLQNDHDRAVQTAWNSGFNNARLKFRVKLTQQHKSQD